jgi:hypothetical protein
MIGATLLLAGVATLWQAGCDSGRAGAAAETTSAAAERAGQSAAPAGVEDYPARRDVSARRPPAAAKLKPGAKTVALPRAGDRNYDKTFDDLRFEIEPGQPFERDMLPDSIEAMAGERVRIRGFILPTPQKRGIRAFVLVRDNQECCFGPGAALYDCILVEMQPGKTAEFSIRPVAVEGTFDIREILGPDGRHLAIYHLAGESVR